MGIFDNLNNPDTMALLGAAQGFGQAAAPSRYKIPLGTALGQGIGGLMGGVTTGQLLQTNNIANQKNALDLDLARQQVPYKIQALQELMNPKQYSGNQPPAQPIGAPNTGGQIVSGVGAQPINNPGNMRPVGASTGFQQFNGDDGYKAMTNDLLGKVAGLSPHMQGKTPTLANVISTWAPPTENNTDRYINFVSQKTGIPPNQKLTVNDVAKIQPAMIQFEGNGPAQPTPQITPQPDSEQQQVKDLTRKIQLQKAVGIDSTGDQDQLNTLTKGIQERQSKTYDVALDMDKGMGESIIPLTQAKQRLTDMANVFKQLQTGSFESNKAKIYSGLKGLGINVDPSKLKDAASVQQQMHDTYVETLKELAANAKGSGSRFTQNEVAALVGQSPNADLQPEANLNLLSQSIGTINHNLGMVNDWYNQGGLKSGEHPTNFQARWVNGHPIDDFVKDARTQIGPLPGMQQSSPNRPSLASILGGKQ